MTIRSEIWTTNIRSLGFRDIGECLTLWKLILRSLGCIDPNKTRNTQNPIILCSPPSTKVWLVLHFWYKSGRLFDNDIYIVFGTMHSSKVSGPTLVAHLKTDICIWVVFGLGVDLRLDTQKYVVERDWTTQYTCKFLNLPSSTVDVMGRNYVIA